MRTEMRPQRRTVRKVCEPVRPLHTNPGLVLQGHPCQDQGVLGEGPNVEGWGSVMKNLGECCDEERYDEAQAGRRTQHFPQTRNLSGASTEFQSCDLKPVGYQIYSIYFQYTI